MKALINLFDLTTRSKVDACHTGLVERLTGDPAKQQELHKENSLRKASLFSTNWEPALKALQQVMDVPGVGLDSSGPSIRLDSKADLTATQSQTLEAAVQALIPWKKGPFDLFGTVIDAEWRSDFKWDRMKSHLPDLCGASVLDIGCNNGYYMFKILEQQPGFVLGIDPYARPYLQYHLVQSLLGDPRLFFQLWGWEHTGLMDPIFDLALCMGIIYHHRDPIQVLKNVRHALKPGGWAVVETIVIPGSESICLFPQDRYARMRNVWFVPTVQATLNMMTRLKFKDVHCISDVLHLPGEQRSTPFNPGPSFQDFLDPNQPECTVEGHPAPRRAILLGRK